jgi:hypothetical protein
MPFANSPLADEVVQFAAEIMDREPSLSRDAIVDKAVEAFTDRLGSEDPEEIDEWRGMFSTVVSAYMLDERAAPRPASPRR